MLWQALFDFCLGVTHASVSCPCASQSLAYIAVVNSLRVKWKRFAQLSRLGGYSLTDTSVRTSVDLVQQNETVRNGNIKYHGLKWLRFSTNSRVEAES